MKKIYSSKVVAAMLKAAYEKEFAAYEFEEKAVLAEVPKIKGPVWFVKARKDPEEIVFIYEMVSQFAYFCPPEFAYFTIDTEHGEKTFELGDGAVAEIISYQGEPAVVVK